MSDYETTQRRRNITVGIFVIVALCSLAFLIFKFEGLPGFVAEVSSFEIFVKFPTAHGVQEDTPVQFCGYQIGRVTKMKPPEPLVDDRTGRTYHQTVCVLSIDKKYVNIPSNVGIRVMTRGLGSSYIELKVDPEKEPRPKDPNRPETVYLVDGMMLQGSTGMTSEFFPEESQEKLDELADGLKSLIASANDIIGDEKAKENIKETLANLADVSAKAATALDEFTNFMVTSTETSEQLGKAAAQLRLIAQKINEGDGTAGMLVNDGRLYENLLESTEQLEVLIDDLKNFVAEYRAEGVKVKL